MYRIFLNGTEVIEPEGFTNLQFIKDRSDIFNGFVVGDYGLVQQKGGLSFFDEISLNIIKQEIIQRGILGEVLIDIYYQSDLIFSGKLDLSSYIIREGQFIECSVSNDTLGDIVNSKRDIEYSIAPTKKINLTKKDYSSGGIYEIGDRTLFKTTASGVHLNLGVPLNPDNKVEGMQVSSISNGVFFIATKATKVHISGVIAWSENSTKDYTFRMIVESGGTTTTDLASYVHTGSLIDRQIIISRTVELVEGGSVAFYLHDSTLSTGFEFNFSTSSYLQIYENPSEEIEDSECYGIMAFDAFKNVLAKIDSSITFESIFLKSGQGSNDFITNGNNIRNYNTDLNLSLTYLIAEFSKLYDLEANLIGSTFKVEKVGLNGLDSEVLESDVNDYYESVDIDRLYSSVKVGYSTWQSEGKIKGAEFNSIRTFETSLSYGSRELNLVSDFITSGFIVEEQRRYQFDSVEKTKDHKFDENLFLIAIENDLPESSQNYNPISNVIANGGVNNFKYAPTNILLNNERKLRHLGEITFASGEGNYSAIINGNSDLEGYNLGQIIPMNVNFNAQLSFSDFKDRVNAYLYTLDENKNIRIAEMTLSLQQNGLGFVTVKGELI